MEEKTLKEEIQEMKEGIYAISKKKENKPKKFRLPSKAKLKKGNLMKGYVTVMQINENGAVIFRKEKIIDSTIKLEDTFHAIDGRDVLSYQGKPLVIQSKTQSNPWNPNDERNDTYGQKHIMSRMMNEVILGAKKKMGVGVSIGVLIIVGIIAYALIAG